MKKNQKNNLLKYELNLLSKGVNYIAGVDEVGRGALAGPMVVAAVILNPKHIIEYQNFFDEFVEYTQINDSKKLTDKKRRFISEFLQRESITYSVVEMSSTQIDSEGIMPCTLTAFYRAIKNLNTNPNHILTDAFEIKQIARQSQTNLQKGDSTSITIAAASIIAKVYRDNLMIKMHEEDKYKVYGFDKHKGYGTKQHIDAIRQHGHSDIHRLSFRVKI